MYDFHKEDESYQLRMLLPDTGKARARVPTMTLCVIMRFQCEMEDCALCRSQSDSLLRSERDRSIADGLDEEINWMISYILSNRD